VVLDIGRLPASYFGVEPNHERLGRSALFVKGSAVADPATTRIAACITTMAQHHAAAQPRNGRTPGRISIRWLAAAPT
jgi:hypothetical protein